MTELFKSSGSNKKTRLNPLDQTDHIYILKNVQTEMLQEAFPGYEAPISAKDMANYIFDFALTGNKYYNGKVLQVSSTNP